MKIILAPDSYKGCLPAREVASLMARALRERHPDWNLVEIPLADGGEGTVETAVNALGGGMRQARVSDPLGRPVAASYGLAGETAVIEVAEACGLRHLTPEERNPLRASSYGVGELMKAAREEGACRFLVGLGGTATCDGGRGMMDVPGIREAMEGCAVEILCDVDNPFTGPNGAARVYAPQKGASPEEVEILEERMGRLADAILSETGLDVRRMPGAGAAGGLGGAFMAYFHAQAVPGIERILGLTRFDALVAGADLIVTGEGKSDLQTLSGKVPFGVLRHSHGIPTVLVSGRIQDREALLNAGFSRLIQVSPDELPTEMAIRADVAADLIRKRMADLVP